MTFPPVRGALAAMFVLTLTACGASTNATGDTATAESTATTAAPTTAAPTTSPTTSPTIATTTSTTTPVDTGPVVTVALSDDDCPNGSWEIDAAGIGPFDALAPSDDVTLTADGGFSVVVQDGRITITADGFALGIASPASVIEMTVAGSTTGRLVVGADTLRFTEEDFAMTAEVTVDGEPAPSKFMVDAFHQTFGSGEWPYTCNADGTYTATYDTPTGPAVATHRPT